METLSKIFESLNKKDMSGIRKRMNESTKRTTKPLSKKQEGIKLNRLQRVVEALNSIKKEKSAKVINEGVCVLKKNIITSRKMESLSRKHRIESISRDDECRVKREREARRFRSDNTNSRESLSRGDSIGRHWRRGEARHCEGSLRDIENAKHMFFSDLDNESIDEERRCFRRNESRRRFRHW